MAAESSAGQAPAGAGAAGSRSQLKLDVLGASFSITADEDEAYMNRVLCQYQAAVNNTQKISGISEPLNVAILTGFLLCDEINKMKQQTENESTEAKERTMNIIAALDQALKGYGNG